MVERWFTRMPGAIVLTVLALSAAAFPTGAAALGSVGAPGSAGLHETGIPAALAPGTITTIGGGVGGPGPATAVGLGQPCALTYSGGTLYVGDLGGVLASGAVRAISLRTGRLTTPVGSSGLLGFTRDGGLATGKAGWPCGIAVDRWHNLVFSDGDQHSPFQSIGNDQVRVLAAQHGTFYGQRMRAGRLYTIAGTGQFGYFGDGGKATNAKLKDPGGVAIDQAGNVIIADVTNDRIRVIAEADGTFYGVRMHRGNIYTVAGNGKDGTAGLGGPATQADLELRFGEGHGGVNFPSSAVRVDHEGNLVIADTKAGLVLVLAAHSGTFYGQQMTVGHLYSIAGGGSATGNGGPATGAALPFANWLAIDHNGNVLVSSASKIRVVAVRNGKFYGQQMAAGDIYSLRLRGQAVSVDGAGNVIVANGSIGALAARSGQFYGRHMTAGKIYQIAGTSDLLLANPTGPATRTEIGHIDDITVDHQGNLVLSTLSSVFILAARTGPGYGRHLVRGFFYTIVNCMIDRTRTPLCGFGPTSGLGAVGFTVDAHGNLVLAEDVLNGLWVVAMHSGSFYGRAMKAGHVYRVAGGGGSQANGIPSSQAAIDAISVGVDPSGNLIETDGALVRLIPLRSGTFFGHHRRAGYIYTIGGGGKGSGSGVPGRAEFMTPRTIRVDRSGNVVLADDNANVVRVIAARTGTFYRKHMTAGDIYTIAGGGTSTADGVPARKAALHVPGVAVDGHGNVLVADWCSAFLGSCAKHQTSKVRVVAERSGVFYGRHMIAGRIYTIAGRGPIGFSGDGGPGTKALLEGAPWVTSWPGHGAVIVDGIRLRLISR